MGSDIDSLREFVRSNTSPETYAEEVLNRVNMKHTRRAHLRPALIAVFQEAMRSEFEAGRRLERSLSSKTE